jgi:hypothetical protein
MRYLSARALVVGLGVVLVAGLTPAVAMAGARDCSFYITASLQNNSEFTPIVIKDTSRWRIKSSPAWHKLKQPLTVRAGRTVKSDLVFFNYLLGGAGCPNNYIFDLDLGCPASGSRRARTVSYMLARDKGDAAKDGDHVVYDMGDLRAECFGSEPTVDQGPDSDGAERDPVGPIRQ